MTRAIRQLLLLAALIGALTAETAVAGPYDIIRDCIDDERLQGNYSDAQLNRALRRLTGDVDEYSNCRSIISAAIGDDPKAKGSKNDGGGGGEKGKGADLDGDGKVTASERRKAKRLARKRARERDEIAAIGDTVGTDDDDDSAAGGGGGPGGIPLPAVLALAALVLGGAGGGTWLAAQRNPTIANALRRAGLPLPPRD